LEKISRGERGRREEERGVERRGEERRGEERREGNKDTVCSTLIIAASTHPKQLQPPLQHHSACGIATAALWLYKYV